MLKIRDENGKLIAVLEDEDNEPEMLEQPVVEEKEEEKEDK